MSEIDFEEIEKELQKELLKRSKDNEPATTGSGISPDGQARIGVLIRLLTAIKDDEDYRQALILSDFLDDDEADRVSAAIEERRRYGISIAPVLDWCAARCAVNKGGHGKSRSQLSIEGLTHTSLYTNISGMKNKKDKNKKED